jgi:glycogen synthase
VCKFDESLSHLGYAASDFMLMPSKFEPCGLPQMVSPIYGSLSVVHDTGGLHDTVEHLDTSSNTGNGFVFKHYNREGLRWAMDEAMSFYRLPQEIKAAQIARIMQQSRARFNHSVTAQQYIGIYEKMLDRQLVFQE